jgi:hypothetical protein
MHGIIFVLTKHGTWPDARHFDMTQISTLANHEDAVVLLEEKNRNIFQLFATRPSAEQHHQMVMSTIVDRLSPL